MTPMELALDTIKWHEANWPGYSTPSLEIARALVAAVNPSGQKPIPEGVYYISDTVRTFNGTDMGSAFYCEWQGRKEEFPQHFPRGLAEDIEHIPSSIFYHEESDQFLKLDGMVMPDAFYARWAHRRHDFPKSYMKRESKPCGKLNNTPQQAIADQLFNMHKVRVHFYLDDMRVMVGDVNYFSTVTGGVTTFGVGPLVECVEIKL
jgi:hypothetical protein